MTPLGGAAQATGEWTKRPIRAAAGCAKHRGTRPHDIHVRLLSCLLLRSETHILASQRHHHAQEIERRADVGRGRGPIRGRQARLQLY